VTAIEPPHEPPRPPLTRDDLASPRWSAAHAGIAVLVVVFLLLGRWQWHAGHKVVPLTQAQLAAWHTPQPVASLLTPQGVDGLKIGQAASAAGSYDAEHQLLVPGRADDGHDGYYVLTPLVTGPGDAVVVNRGWLASRGGSEPDIPAPPSGRVTVTGWVAASESTSGEVNENGILQAVPAAPATGPHEVSVISAAQLVNMWPYHLPDGYLSATDGASSSGGLTAIAAPLPPHGTSWDLLNLGYAFQWSLFAAVTLGWYALYWRRELRASAAELVEDGDAAAPAALLPKPAETFSQLETGESAR
jgi:cytochrome oxidase assembly protein ShyY1